MKLAPAAVAQLVLNKLLNPSALGHVLLRVKQRLVLHGLSQHIAQQANPDGRVGLGVQNSLGQLFDDLDRCHGVNHWLFSRDRSGRTLEIIDLQWWLSILQAKSLRPSSVH